MTTGENEYTYVGFVLYVFDIVMWITTNDDMKWYLVRMNDVHHVAELRVIS